MLTKLGRDVLEYCRTHDPENGNLDTDIIKSVSCKSRYRLKLCCEYLNDEGYLKGYKEYTDGGFAIYLNHKGLCYDEIKNLETKSFIFRSIVVPIFVSAATTIILGALA